MMNILKNNGPALTGVCVAMLLLSPVAASAAVSKGDVLGTTEQAVRAALEQKGYTVQEIEIEDGVIEAEFIAQGSEMEIEVDKTTGQVLEVEDD
ncbi:MAG: PepSY domain-containing protein [Alphaproteobacteria bacterium]|nr:PepSY domain-containing protein [Alphaproteobacteria bacterium]